MQFINYLSASIISFLGLLAGIILIRIAPEEQKPLRRYFAASKKILLLLIFAFVAFYYSKNITYFLMLSAFFALSITIEYRIHNELKKSMIISAALGAIFFLSSANQNLFIIESSLIFIYGIPTASLIYTRKEKNHYKILLYNIAFLIVANISYFA